MSNSKEKVETISESIILKTKLVWTKPKIFALDVSKTFQGNPGSTAEGSAYTHS